MNYMSKDAMDKAIKSIAGRAAKLDKDIQECALSALHHNEQHQDVVFVNRLYLALGKGHRRSALTEWFLTFGRVVANEDSKTKADKPFLYAKDKKTDLAAAAIKPWYECKKEPEPDGVFDVQKAYMALLKKVDTALKEGKEVSGFTARQMERLRAVMSGNVAADVSAGAPTIN